VRVLVLVLLGLFGLSGCPTKQASCVSGTGAATPPTSSADARPPTASTTTAKSAANERILSIGRTESGSLVVATQSALLQIDPTNQAASPRRVAYSHTPRDVIFSVRGDRALLLTEDGLEIWSTQTLAPVQSVTLTTPPQSALLSDDGSTAVTTTCTESAEPGTRGCAVQAYRSGAPAVQLREILPQDTLQGVSPDGNNLWISREVENSTAELSVYDLGSGKRIYIDHNSATILTQPEARSTSALRFDDKLLIVAQRHKIDVIDLKTGNVVRRKRFPERVDVVYVYSHIVLPGRKQVASVYTDGGDSVSLWNYQTGAETRVPLKPFMKHGCSQCAEALLDSNTIALDESNEPTVVMHLDTKGSLQRLLHKEVARGETWMLTRDGTKCSVSPLGAEAQRAGVPASLCNTENERVGDYILALNTKGVGAAVYQINDRAARLVFGRDQ
jgi:hypothetical protein